MLAVIGVSLLCLCVTTFVWIHRQVRRAHPPSWANSDMLLQLIAVAWVGILASGAGFVGLAIDRFATKPPTPLNYGEMIAVVIGSALVIRLASRLREPPRGQTPTPA